MKRFLPFLLILVIVALALQADAQGCAMCAATTESTTSAGSSAARGINKGVLYIFMMPYLIIGTIWYFWWKSKRK